ncbi:MAG: sensor histidine kinase [Prevotella sp.]|nr:sensor histidine kinase [Prevotella sp.]
MIIVAIIVFVVLVIGGTIYRHQCLLRDRAQLMRDAMRHHDFSFHLPTKGLLFGERALQEALNDMGQDIQRLAAHNEVESWQRLTRVLTHEIMNVTTPILSISQAYLSNPHIKGTSYEEGIQAIHNTCTGLAAFVDSYRKLTQLQEPVLKHINVNMFCTGISALYPNLHWEIDMLDDLSIHADENLLRQVFINLVKNALEANAKTIGIRHIAPSKTAKQGKVAFGKLQISNDGHVIPDDVAREIFIPFFTTKQFGSGIGLSLSRQILMMQKLTLSLRERPVSGYNVTFEIENDCL